MRKKNEKTNIVDKLTRLSDGKTFYLTTDTRIAIVTGLYGPQITMLKTKPEYGQKRGWKHEYYDASELAYKYINVLE